jgi:hypothetical protein
VLSRFGGIRRRTQEKYKTFVREGIRKPSPWDKLRGQILLGDETFVLGLKPYIKRVQAVREIPREQRFAGRPMLEEFLKDAQRQSKVIRNRMILEAHLRYGCTLVEIGKAIGLHYTTVSRIVNQK